MNYAMLEQPETHEMRCEVLFSRYSLIPGGPTCLEDEAGKKRQIYQSSAATSRYALGGLSLLLKNLVDGMTGKGALEAIVVAEAKGGRLFETSDELPGPGGAQWSNPTNACLSRIRNRY